MVASFRVSTVKHDLTLREGGNRDGEWAARWRTRSRLAALDNMVDCSDRMVCADGRRAMLCYVLCSRSGSLPVGV